MEGDNVLEVRDLHVHYVTDDGTARAVNGAGFSLKPGETLGIVGETGAGKTTTALAILRLVPDPPGKIVGGEILFRGEDLLAKSEREMRSIRGNKISMIFQDPMTSLNPVFTVGRQIAENVQLHQRLSWKASMNRAAEMLDIVGIPRSRVNNYPSEFSGGMKQRVVIAMALACNPALLIADEPTTALDVTIQAQILEIIRNLNDEFQTAMIMISHDLGVVAEVSDRVAVMYAGELVERGTVDEVFENPSHPYTKGLFGSIPDLEATGRARLTPVSGLMPDAMDIPPGCSFHPRCPAAFDRCPLSSPHAYQVAETHDVKCFLYSPDEPNPATEVK